MQGLLVAHQAPTLRRGAAAAAPVLQGQTGKFGAVELSDIGAFAALPDGKVVAGTEDGDLLVWEGGLIKVFGPGHQSCPQPTTTRSHRQQRGTKCCGWRRL